MEKPRQNVIIALLGNLLQMRGVLFQAVPGDDKAATFLQILALQGLHRLPGATVGELATTLCISPSAATQLSNRLADAGLIGRTSDKNDRRIVCLFVTKKGEKQLRILEETIAQKADQYFSSLSLQDINRLNHILGKLKKKEGEGSAKSSREFHQGI